MFVYFTMLFKMSAEPFSKALLSVIAGGLKQSKALFFLRIASGYRLRNDGKQSFTTASATFHD